MKIVCGHIKKDGKKEKKNRKIWFKKNKRKIKEKLVEQILFYFLLEKGIKMGQTLNEAFSSNKRQMETICMDKGIKSINWLYQRHYFYSLTL